MSGDTGTRDWAAKFAPPPPPSLRPERPAPEPEAAAARLHAVPVVPAQTPQPTAEPAAQVPDAGALATASKAERARGAELLAALSDMDISSSLVGVRRSPGVQSFDVQLDQADDLERIAIASDTLASVLDCDEVRVAGRSGEGQVRIDLMRGAAGQAAGRQMAIWVPVHVRDALLAARTPTEESTTEFFLGAFNRQYTGLDSLFPRRASTPGPMPVKRMRRRRLETPVQIWLYLNDEQREILDDAVTRSGAGSRSALATRILATDLGIPEEAPAHATT